MQALWPVPRPADRDGDLDPVAVYAADARPRPPGRPWVLVNMIASADGSAVDGAGRSGGLGGPADRAVLAALRGVADVIVAGAGTVIAEDYGPSRPTERVRRLRLDRGQAPAPRIAVVTASLGIDPAHRLFREATPEARPLVLTVARADPRRRRALEAVADVVVAGEDRLDWHRALATLASTTGASAVLCEGGPATVAQLVEHDLVDELCLTVAPRLQGGPGPRITQGAPAAARALRLARVLVDDDFLFLRYLRAGEPHGADG